MLRITSPYDLSLIKEISLDGKKEVENALSIAHSLFQDQDNWLKPHERISILKRVVRLMEGQVEELTELASKEGGKPLNDSKVEVLRAINGVEIAIGHISQLSGKEVPMALTSSSENRLAFTRKEPIGVVVSISAFNHPLNLIVHQVITAIASGCPVIIKPALTTPLSCLAMVDILSKAGLPKGWAQTLICENDMAELLATDSRVGYFSFIGSAKVGWHLKSKLANGTRCALEHGGVAPVIIEKDVNIDEILPSILKGGFYHAGQVCVSVQKLFIEESICNQFSNKLGKLAKELIVGSQLSDKTEVGPLISPKEVNRVELWVNEAIQRGATLITGGSRISNTCYEPTVLLNPPHDSKVSTHEIFGPVVCIYSYKDRNQAIKIANSLDVHFQASVFTKDIDVALECTKKLNATAVMINDHTAFRVDWMPFGGRDSSGIGMGGIQYSMNEMTRDKLTVIHSKLI